MFLTLVKAGQFDKAFSFVQKTWAEEKSSKDLEKLFKDYKLKDFALLSSTNVSNVKTEALVALDFGKKKHQAIANVICESWPFKTDAFGDWGVNPDSLLKAVVEEPPVDEQLEALKDKAKELNLDFPADVSKKDIEKLVSEKEEEVKSYNALFEKVKRLGYEPEEGHTPEDNNLEDFIRNKEEEAAASAAKDAGEKPAEEKAKEPKK